MNKRIMALILIMFAIILFISCNKKDDNKEVTPTKEETTKVTSEVKDTVDVLFNVSIPQLDKDDVRVVIFGSFNDNKISLDNELIRNGDVYTITLELKKNQEYTYRFLLYGNDDSDFSMVEVNNNERNVTHKFEATTEDSITLSINIERFKNVRLLSEKKELCDSLFYDNNGGDVHILSYSNGKLDVTYTKKANHSWACIVRPLEEEIIGKLYSIKISFVGEKGVSYLFKLEGGSGTQEEFATGTGTLQVVNIMVSEGSTDSTKLVIFGDQGKTGTNDNPIVGHYVIYSIDATIREPIEYVYEPGENPIHILAIGNSFSDDGLWLLYDILSDLGYDDIILGILYIGGCTVSTHKDNLLNNKALYTYRVNRNGTWVNKNNYKALTALQEEKWDYISLQQASDYSGLKEYYVQEDIDLIYDLATQIASVNNDNIKVVWQMTWAYQANSTHASFPKYDKDQMKMYNGIIEAVQEKIVPDQFNPIVVPSGTAIQNLRTSFLGDTITRDGYHLNEAYGRYTAALTWAITLTGLDIASVGAPTSVASKLVPLCKEAATNAYLNPFEVTESIYKVDSEIANIDLSTMDILDQDTYIIGNGYYNSTDGNKFLTPYQDGTDFCNGYITTILFTKDTLPVGSVIVLGSGYQYRPEGWLNEAKQTSRNDNTTSSIVLVTDEWWGSYIYRAFNISKVGGGVLTGEEYDNALKNFTIYVPRG